MCALGFSASSLALDAGKVQAVIRDGLEAKRLTLKSISCPMDADYEAGNTVICSGSDDEENLSEFTVKIGLKKVDWTSQKDIVDLKPLGPILSKKIGAKLHKAVVVTCEDKAVFRKEHCEVTCDATVDGEERLVLVTSCPDKNGDMKYKID
jgi:hypothetical protein